MADIAVLDVDGTLVDTNYHHALAWYRAFRRHDLTVPVWRLHRGIGMGGDLFVEHVTDGSVEERLGDALRAAWEEEFDELLDEVVPFDGARELIGDLSDRGFRVVLASSGKAKHVDVMLGLLHARDVVEAWTTSDDAEHSKPAPDLVQSALDRVGGGTGVMLGDSPWDCLAAGKAGAPTVAVRTGGFSTEELTEAGAVRVLDSLVELRQRLDETPLGRPG